ncbi:MAG TPA: ABC-type transport auxiliary lipoprotein family protein [Dokdonella sp.]|uniref:ABC-type transport auxiliary lipoprotein family protein n=1 Tax=Dokdonella sp. TaxID=2291710 RepID=UPI002D7EFA6F|nr:ABC-type transport auxiliary lipoprotein family protein [Dokdonella sp.]HET9034479.1 ABC-type transport auxiliary lipoprotein family protein [Dokdonella sp.]
MIRTARFTIIGASLLLGACAALSGKHASFAVYAPQLHLNAAADDAAATKIRWQLLVDTPHASAALDTTRIAVMTRPGVLEVYADARWRDPAPAMLRSLIVQAFDKDGRVGGVSAIDSGLNGDYSLSMDLRDFQIELVDGSARAAIRFTARLFDYRSNRIVSSRSFEAEVAAAGSDIASAMVAFEQALDQLMPEVVDWTVQQGVAHYAAVSKSEPESL